MRPASPLVLAAWLLTGCPSTPTGTGGAGGAKDGGSDAPEDVGHDVPVIPPPDGSIVHPCNLPGSVQFTTGGTITVPGGAPSWPSLAFLHLPVGFCAHYFGTVGNARQIRFAPGGELFVASPTGLTTGGGPGGQAAILVLPDDDLDGVADKLATFQGNLPNTQGMLFANGHFYYQDLTKIVRVPYDTGQRTPAGPPETVADITIFVSNGHWPKTLDMADDGSIYVGNGSDQPEVCAPPNPFRGGILRIDPAPGPNPGGIPIAKGFRNPIAVRCAKGHNQCFALELALDYSAVGGGREKMVPIRKGDDWGFPCCATKDVPYPGGPPGLNCSGVTQDTNAFLIGDTPFGVDFEPGLWPAAWSRHAYVVTHGTAGNWTGARMVAIPMDPSTGLPTPSSNTMGGNVGMVDFATGWDDGTRKHGRPAAVAFAPDGRLFVANDNDGTIFWIAPIGM